MRTKILISATLLMMAFSVGLFVAIGDRTATRYPDISGLLWPEPPVIESFRLIDDAGNAFTERNLRDRWTFVFFGFTNCPDICPTTLNTLNQVYEQLRDYETLFEKFQVLFVSVDPDRDKREMLGTYVDYFNKAFVGATADDEQLSQFARQFGVLYLKVDTPDGAGYTMDHTASVLLVDPELRFIGIFSQPHSAGDITDRLTRMVSFVEGTKQ